MRKVERLPGSGGVFLRSSGNFKRSEGACGHMDLGFRV